MWSLNHIRELVVSTITVIIKLLSNTPSFVHMLLWLHCLSINNNHAHHYNTHKTLFVVKWASMLWYDVNMPCSHSHMVTLPRRQSFPLLEGLLTLFWSEIAVGVFFAGWGMVMNSDFWDKLGQMLILWSEEVVEMALRFGLWLPWLPPQVAGQCCYTQRCLR